MLKLSTWFSAFALSALSASGVQAQTPDSAALRGSPVQMCVQTCWDEAQKIASAKLNQCAPRVSENSRASCMTSGGTDMSAARSECRTSCQLTNGQNASAAPTPDFPDGYDPLKKPAGFEYGYWTDEMAKTSIIRGPKKFTMKDE